MSTYTTPSGIIITDAAVTTADFMSVLKGIFDGSRGGTGLNEQTIPTFPNFEALNAAYPNPTVLTTPPLVRIYGVGDDFGLLVYWNEVSDSWTPQSGFAGMEEATTGGIAPIANVGGTLGVLSKVVPDVPGTAQRLVTVEASVLIDFGNATDVAELFLLVNGESKRAGMLAAPANMTGAITLPTYSFFVDPGHGFELQTVYKKRSGTGTIQASIDDRYTTLQYVAFDL